MKNNIHQLKLIYVITSFFVLLGGVSIYGFFRNTNNMLLFRFFPILSFPDIMHIPVKPDSIWLYMFIYNLPYGLWCLSGLLLIRSIWLKYAKWRAIYSGIFIAIVMSYVILKIPKVILGTFDVLDLVFMGTFAFLESFIFSMFIRRKIVW